MSLCDFSKFTGKLHQCTADIQLEKGSGSRRRPSGWPYIYTVIVWKPSRDQLDDIRTRWDAPVVFRSILNSEAEAALAEAQETIAAATEWERMRKQT